MALTPAFAVICGLLVVAGAAKLRAPGPAQASLGVIGIRVPAAAVRASGMGELAIGLTAAVWPGPATGGLVALAYGTFCGFVILVLRAAGRPTGCGCFGDADAGAGPTHAVLNGAAGVVGVAAALSPPPGVTWMATRPLEIAVPLVVGTIGAAFAAYLAFAWFPSAWRAYGSGARI
jgi:hypothetical protein